MRFHRKAFTLVELLVVIGIIALLVGILLPALNRAKMAGDRTACLSNLRQLCQVTRMYTDDYKGFFPFCAAGTAQPEDWIYWQPTRNQDDGRLVPYQGKKFKPEYYRCPSDDWTRHLVNAPNGNYRYSYTINYQITGYFAGTRPPNPNPAPPAGWPPLKITSVHHAAKKILFVCESEVSVDDGTWAADRYSGSPLKNVLSNRHDKGAENVTNPKSGKGCVVFLDGHGDFFPREDSFLPEYYDPKQ